MDYVFTISFINPSIFNINMQIYNLYRYMVKESYYKFSSEDLYNIAKELLIQLHVIKFVRD